MARMVLKCLYFFFFVGFRIHLLVLLDMCSSDQTTPYTRCYVQLPIANEKKNGNHERMYTKMPAAPQLASMDDVLACSESKYDSIRLSKSCKASLRRCKF